MTQHTETETLETAAIDYAHHIDQGRTLRSEAFWAVLHALRLSMRMPRATKAAPKAAAAPAPAKVQGPAPMRRPVHSAAQSPVQTAVQTPVQISTQAAAL